MKFYEYCRPPRKSAFAEMSKMFNATSASENTEFVLARLDEGVGLVKINKEVGLWRIK